MKHRIIHEDTLKKWVNAIAGSETRLIAPKEQDGVIAYKEAGEFDQIHFDHINTEMSLKEYFLPISEPIIEFTKGKSDVDMKEIEPDAPPTVIFGCRSCDAASLPVMDEVFKWDYYDKYWFKRREATTIVTLSCTDCDYACFCLSVGQHPGGTNGSDIQLTPIEGDRYIVEALTNKGKKLLDSFAMELEESDTDKEASLKACVEKQGKKFDLERIQPWLERQFESDFWKKNTLYCIGCGVCTFVCPTCHCFDIVDEGSMFEGKRYKNWDACQFRMFTIHASGHNPRERQDERHRQRLSHKFNYYVEKFGKTLCTGCGRCVRKCPVDLNIVRLLSMMSEDSTEKIKKG